MSAMQAVAVVVAMVIGGVTGAVSDVEEAARQELSQPEPVAPPVAARQAQPGSSHPVPPAQPRHTPFVAPTTAPISERFDHDAGAYGPGNRGLDFATSHGDEVRAIGDGAVTFSGPVANVSWVTVQHPNGLRSTVGPMARIDVDVGDLVRRGQIVGTVDGPLHLSIRRGDRYLDPEPLLSFGRLRAVLVPVGGQKG